jgi:thiamine pyrophosphokinase
MKSLSRTAVIFAAGKYSEHEKPVKGDITIAADGGYEFCKAKKILPDVIIGDFDSLSDIPTDIKTVTLPRVKDVTDTAAAVEYAKEYDEFHIYGGTGGRLDHTLANIALAADLSKADKRAYIYGDGQIITAVTDGTVTFSPPENLPAYISVFSFCDLSEGVDISGLKYPLENAVLKASIPLGVSNEFTSDRAVVSVQRGTIIIIYDERAVIKTQ